MTYLSTYITCSSHIIHKNHKGAIMGNKKTTTKLSYILLALIIAAGICRFSYGFFVQKQGAHSDETWSFGLANSYYEPYIQYSDDTSEYRNVDTSETTLRYRKVSVSHLDRCTITCHVTHTPHFTLCFCIFCAHFSQINICSS